MRKYHLTYRDALRKINSDFNLGLIDPEITHKSRIKPIKKVVAPQFKEKKATIIDVKYAKWTPEDLIYWFEQGWTKEMLDRASIRPISFFWLTMKHKNIIEVPFSTMREKAFCYDFYRHEGIFRRKLYFPEREGAGRFVSNVDNTVIQNWDLLPKSGGDLLFITSSKKDCGPHWRLNGYSCNAIAPNNEIVFIPEDIFWTKIKPRWKRIVAWLDNDPTGIENALKWAKKYQIEAVWNPLRCPHKDQSEFVKNEGLREFNYLQKTLLKL